VTRPRETPGFDTFYLVLNPTPTPARLHARFSFPDGQTIDRAYDVAPGARRNVWLNDVLGQVGAIAARFTSEGGVPVIVERSIYWAWSEPNGWLEGTNSIGVTSGAATWHVPEGSTSAAFEDFLLVDNPTDEVVTVYISVFTEDGRRETLEGTVPARGRSTFYMLSVLERLGLPPRSSFATRVTSEGGVPIVVEHAMYWQREGDRYWHGGGSAFGIAR